MRISATAEQEEALQAARKQISQRVIALNEADSLRARVLTAVREAEGKVQERMTRLNPEDNAEVAALASERARISVLVDWYNGAQSIKLAINTLAAQMRPVRNLVEATAQIRDVAEFGVAQAAWFPELETLFLKTTLADQLACVRAVAQRVLTDLNVLCQERRRCRLTRNETLDGVLRDGARAVRKLTPAECRAGYADL